MVGLPLPLEGGEVEGCSVVVEERAVGKILPMNVHRFLFGAVVCGESAVSLGLAESAVSSFVRVVVSEERRLYAVD